MLAEAFLEAFMEVFSSYLLPVILLAAGISIASLVIVKICKSIFRGSLGYSNTFAILLVATLAYRFL